MTDVHKDERFERFMHSEDVSTRANVSMARGIIRLVRFALAVCISMMLSAYYTFSAFASFLYRCCLVRMCLCENNRQMPPVAVLHPSIKSVHLATTTLVSVGICFPLTADAAGSASRVMLASFRALGDDLRKDGNQQTTIPRATSTLRSVALQRLSRDCLEPFELPLYQIDTCLTPQRW